MSEPSAIVYSLDILRPNALGVEAPEANGQAYVERQYISFEEIEGVNHRDRKTIQRIDPIGSVPLGSPPVIIEIGAVDTPGETFQYTQSADFDSIDTRQLDFHSSGRYHAIRISYDGFDNISLSGLDIDLNLDDTRG